MGILDLFRRKAQAVETRSSGTGYTAQLIASRAEYITGRSGLAELTGTVQGCVTLWENGLSLADVTGTDLLTPGVLAIAARALGLRGEAVFFIDDAGLIPATDWDLSTRMSRPVAYRLSLPEIGGGTTRTALAGEVLHLRIGCDVSAPYCGQAPLRRAQLSAGLLHQVETALAEAFADMPLGSQVLPFPESPANDTEHLGRSFRGQRGRVLLRESVQVTAAGGPAPQSDWRPSDLTPDLSRSAAGETLAAARASIEMVYGIPPGLSNPATTGPMIRECQRHLAQWCLQPIAAGIAEEATAKLGQPVTLDVMRPLQAFDAGGRARALSGIVQAMAMAKESGVDPNLALQLVDWERSE